MQVSVLDPAPIKLSQVEIVRLEFASKRLKMEKKYLRLQEMADKAESNAQNLTEKGKKNLYPGPKIGYKTRIKYGVYTNHIAVNLILFLLLILTNIISKYD